MSSSVDFSLSYHVPRRHLRLQLRKIKILNQHPEPYAKVFILPNRKKTQQKPLEPLGEEELTFSLNAYELDTSTVEIVFFDVNRTPAREFMGMILQLSNHSCLGTIQVPLKNHDLKTPTAFSETIMKCDDRGKAAHHMCQILCFEEDFKSFCMQFCKHSGPLIEFANDKVVNPIFQHLIENTEGSRGPSLYFIGRGGMESTSLINALANLHVADVTDATNTPGMSKYYSLEFSGGASWKIFDSHALSEVFASQESIADPMVRVKQQITEFKPDVVLYFVSAIDTGNCLNELNLLATALTELQEILGGVPPIVVVITHCDSLSKVSEWPPEQFPTKQNQLKDLILSTSTRLSNATGRSPLETEEPYRGYNTAGKMPVRYLIPVALPEEGELWNIEVLAMKLGKLLPAEARYQYCQPQKRPYLMKQYSSRYIKYFSGAAVAVSAMPMPGSEILILTALQILMICVIAHTAGRELSVSTAVEFTNDMGVTILAEQGCLRIAGELVKFVPVAGPLLVATVAGAGTYAMGRSAQAYFFEGQKRRLSDFRPPADITEWTGPVMMNE